jgi:hypothetical protein
MAAVANNPKFAKKVGIPQSVGEDYIKADEGRKFNRGGEMEMKHKRVSQMGMLKQMQKEGRQAARKAGDDVKSLKQRQKTDRQELLKSNPNAGKRNMFMDAPAKQKPAASGNKMGIGKARQEAKVEAGNRKAVEAYKNYKPGPVATPAPTAASGKKMGIGKFMQDQMGGKKTTAPTNLPKANKSPAPNLKQVAGAGLAGAGSLMNMKKGGKVKTKCMAGGGYVRAADGCTKKGKTKGKII